MLWQRLLSSALTQDRGVGQIFSATRGRTWRIRQAGKKILFSTVYRTWTGISKLLRLGNGSWTKNLRGYGFISHNRVIKSHLSMEDRRLPEGLLYLRLVPYRESQIGPVCNEKESPKKTTLNYGCLVGIEAPKPKIYDRDVSRSFSKPQWNEDFCPWLPPTCTWIFMLERRLLMRSSMTIKEFGTYGRLRMMISTTAYWRIDIPHWVVNCDPRTNVYLRVRIIPDFSKHQAYLQGLHFPDSNEHSTASWSPVFAITLLDLSDLSEPSKGDKDGAFT